MKIGRTPRELDDLSLAEWRAMLDGWNAAQNAGPAPPAAPTADEHAARLARLKDR